MLNKSLLIFGLVTGSLSVLGQELVVHGRFERDSVKLGEPIEYYLTASYPKQYQVLFPDSTFAFTPFEFVKKKFLATRTTHGISYDSAIYTLATFEIDSVQFLSLPVFQVQKRDCLTYRPIADTVFFKELVGPLPDTLAANQLPLKVNTSYNPVQWLLNYPLISILVGSLLMVALIIWLVFGKRIRKYFTVKRLVRSHQAFMMQFEHSLDNLKKKFSPEQAEASITIWKRYMEELSAVPYTKYTTREILEKEGTHIKSALASIDRMIYGRITPSTLDSFVDLKEFTQHRFTQKMEDVKNG